METEEEIQNVNVHHGHNIRRTRIEKNIKQDALAALVNMTQPNVSKYEKMRVIEDEMLNRFARALNVPVEYLKTLEEDAPSVVFENITNNVHDNKDSSMGSTGYNNDSITNTFNPIDKISTSVFSKRKMKNMLHLKNGFKVWNSKITAESNSANIYLHINGCSHPTLRV
mgnify:CR=1 FL=1